MLRLPRTLLQFTRKEIEGAPKDCKASRRVKRGVKGVRTNFFRCSTSLPPAEAILGFHFPRSKTRPQSLEYTRDQLAPDYELFVVFFLLPSRLQRGNLQSSIPFLRKWDPGWPFKPQLRQCVHSLQPPAPWTDVLILGVKGTFLSHDLSTLNSQLHVPGWSGKQPRRRLQTGRRHAWRAPCLVSNTRYFHLEECDSLITWSGAFLKLHLTWLSLSPLFHVEFWILALTSTNSFPTM